MSDITFIRNENEGFRIHHISEIYQGQSPTLEGGRVVPNVGDHVIDDSTGFSKTYRVNSVTEDLVAVLSPLYSDESQNNNSNDVLNTGLSNNSVVKNIVYLDTKGIKSRMTTEHTQYVYGEEFVSCKIFLGTDTTVTGEVISQRYNPEGVVISDVIPLEEISDSPNTPPSAGSSVRGIKRVPVTVVDATQLTEGSLVTIVYYTATNSSKSMDTFVVTMTDAIRDTDYNTKAIQSIDLVSPLVADIGGYDSAVILNDYGVPFATNSLQCDVTYTDGSVVRLDVDGVKIRLIGVSEFDHFSLGQPTSLTLAYYPAPNEAVIGVTGTSVRVKTKQYLLANNKADEAFALKVFIEPVWGGPTVGYNIRYWVLNDENSFMVEPAGSNIFLEGDVDSGTASYNPRLYGTKQHLLVRLNVDGQLPGSYPTHPMTQRVAVTLNTPTAEGLDPWIIDYPTDGTGTLGLRSRIRYISSANTLDIRSPMGDYSNLEEMLDALYEPSYPIYDPTLQFTALKPTHIRIEVPGFTHTMPIEDWSAYIDTTGFTITGNSTGRLVWLLRNSTNDPFKILSTTPLMVKTTI